eukprot:XP_019922258.1 PREDICTED: uncharacterized protein LOC105327013 [Crassostrea gigas]
MVNLIHSDLAGIFLFNLIEDLGTNLGFLKRHGRNIRESDNNTRKEIDLHEENWLDAIELKETDVHVCEDDDGHFIPRKLLLFKGEKFKGESNGGLGVRKSIKTFRAPVSNCARSTAIEVLENERDGRHRVRKSTKTFRAPDPNSTRSAAIEGSWIGDNGSRRVIRKSTKTFRAPDPKSTRSSLVEYLIKCGSKHKTRANIPQPSMQSQKVLWIPMINLLSVCFIKIP